MISGLIKWKTVCWSVTRTSLPYVCRSACRVCLPANKSTTHKRARVLNWKILSLHSLSESFVLRLILSLLLHCSSTLPAFVNCVVFVLVGWSIPFHVLGTWHGFYTVCRGSCGRIKYLSITLVSSVLKSKIKPTHPFRIGHFYRLPIKSCHCCCGRVADSRIG